MKKKLFLEKIFPETFLGKVEKNDDNLTGNNLGKRPKTFLSQSDKFLQEKRAFWYKNFLRDLSSGHVE